MTTNSEPVNALSDENPVPLRSRLIAATALSEAQRLTLQSLCRNALRHNSRCGAGIASGPVTDGFAARLPVR